MDCEFSDVLISAATQRTEEEAIWLLGYPRRWDGPSMPDSARARTWLRFRSGALAGMASEDDRVVKRHVTDGAVLNRDHRPPTVHVVVREGCQVGESLVALGACVFLRIMKEAREEGEERG